MRGFVPREKDRKWEDGCRGVDFALAHRQTDRQADKGRVGQCTASLADQYLVSIGRSPPPSVAMVTNCLPWVLLAPSLGCVLLRQDVMSHFPPLHHICNRYQRNLYYLPCTVNHTIMQFFFLFQCLFKFVDWRNRQLSRTELMTYQ